MIIYDGNGNQILEDFSVEDNSIEAVKIKTTNSAEGITTIPILYDEDASKWYFTIDLDEYDEVPESIPIYLLGIVTTNSRGVWNNSTSFSTADKINYIAKTVKPSLTQLWAYTTDGDTIKSSNYPHIYYGSLGDGTQIPEIISWLKNGGFTGERKIYINYAILDTFIDIDEFDITEYDYTQISYVGWFDFIIDRPDISFEDVSTQFYRYNNPTVNVATRTLIQKKAGTIGRIDVTDYGLSPSNTDNSSALRSLVSQIANGDVGASTLFFPDGTYIFNSENSTPIVNGFSDTIVNWISNLSVIGESIENTILKVTGSTTSGACLFGYFGEDENDWIEGCRFENFTVDGSELEMESYTSNSKAFYFQNVKDCRFSFIRCIGTASTSVGIDYLDNVIIDNVYCYNSGRLHAESSPGGAGIGIGTGLWENENFIIQNCVCDTCGHFGIFVEDQNIFANNDTPAYPKGQVIANNITRNCRYAGLGVRGGQYVLVTGNVSYENGTCGFSMDYKNKDVLVQGNVFAGNPYGIRVMKENSLKGYNYENCVFANNLIVRNTTYGFYISATSEYVPDVVLIGNVFRDNTASYASSTGRLTTSGNVDDLE